MTRIRLLTRREFLEASTGVVAAGVVPGHALRPSDLFGAAGTWEADGYNHKVVVRVYDPDVASAYTFGSPYY